MKRFLTASTLLVLLAIPFIGEAQLGDRAEGYVTDTAKIFSQEQKTGLEERLRTFEASTTVEIAVVVIPELPSDSTIELYAVELFEEWGIGKKGADNGILFLTAIGDRKTRIEVGYGLEGDLPDATASKIIRNTVIPQFQKGDYVTGIIDGTQSIMDVTQGSEPAEDREENSGGGSIFAFIGFGFILLQLIIGVLERSKSWWLGGIIGGVFGGIITLFQFWGIATWGGITLTTLFVITGLFIDRTVSRAYQK